MAYRSYDFTSMIFIADANLKLAFSQVGVVVTRPRLAARSVLSTRIVLLLVAEFKSGSFISLDDIADVGARG